MLQFWLKDGQIDVEKSQSHCPLFDATGAPERRLQRLLSMKRFIFLLGLLGTEGKPAVDDLVQKALEQCEDGKGNGLFQKFHQKHVRQHVIEREDPLKKRIYLVGTSHKVGSQLLRNTMRWIFDSLGATDSCNCQYGGGFITSKVSLDPLGKVLECSMHPVNLRFKNQITGDAIVKLRQQTKDKEMFRGVMGMRDPLEMIVSAYCCLGSYTIQGGLTVLDG